MTNDQILRCAELCVDSYADKCLDGFYDVDDLRYGEHFVDGTWYITIRGTDNLENALRDLWVRPSRMRPGTWVHKGFFSGMTKLLETHFMGFCWNEPVIFTGHSFGAAVALLLADLHKDKCVTFGCPRPYLRCNGLPNPQHIRIMTDDDVITHIPRLCYHMPQPGREIILRDRDSEWIDIKDHSMKTYHNRLKRYLKWQ